MLNTTRVRVRAYCPNTHNPHSFGTCTRVCARVVTSINHHKRGIQHGIQAQVYGQPVARLIVSVPVEIVERLTNSSANAPDTGDRLAEHILPDATEANLSGWRLWRSWNGTRS